MAADRLEVEKNLRTLLGWAGESSPDAIPTPVLKKAALIVGDNLAATVAARDQEEVKRIQEHLVVASRRQDASVFSGRGWRADPVSAAVANTVACSWPELDEGYARASCHGGLYTFGPVLAEAESEALETRAALHAIVLGYEIAARFARTWRFPRFTIHPHAAFSAVGAAAAVGTLRRFDPDRLLTALTAASTFASPGSYSHAIEGAQVRNVWAAHGVWNGIRCADWAGFGVGGYPGSPFDAYTTGMGVAPEPGELVAEIGEDWAILHGFHKVHACCQSAHTAVDAALALLGQLPDEAGPTAIQRIVVETPRLEMSNAVPENTLAAKFSIPQIVAATFVFGHAGAGAFTDESLTRPEIVRLRNSVELRAIELGPANRHSKIARVSVVLQDGRTLVEEREKPRGDPDAPFSDDVVLEKIETLTAEAYPRMAQVMRDLVALQEGRLARPWRESVEEMVGKGRLI